MTENVRFIDWTRGKNGNPYTFRNRDYQSLCTNKNLFARKFSEKEDKSVILKIMTDLKKGVSENTQRHTQNRPSSRILLPWG